MMYVKRVKDQNGQNILSQADIFLLQNKYGQLHLLKKQPHLLSAKVCHTALSKHLWQFTRICTRRTVCPRLFDDGTCLAAAHTELKSGTHESIMMCPTNTQRTTNCKGKKWWRMGRLSTQWCECHAYVRLATAHERTSDTATSSSSQQDSSEKIAKNRRYVVVSSYYT